VTNAFQELEDDDYFENFHKGIFLKEILQYLGTFNEFILFIKMLNFSNK
jgi:hypothetical protein